MSICPVYECLRVSDSSGVYIAKRSGTEQFYIMSLVRNASAIICILYWAYDFITRYCECRIFREHLFPNGLSVGRHEKSVVTHFRDRKSESVPSRFYYYFLSNR